jgi:hypothetical protein
LKWYNIEDDDRAAQTYLPSSQNIIHVPSNIRRLIRDKFLIECIESNINIIETRFTINATEEQITQYVTSTYNKYFATGRSEITVVANKTFYIEFDSNIATTSISIYARPDVLATQKNRIVENFKHASIVKWVYDPQYLTSMDMALNIDALPLDCFYPWLGDESLADYYDRFMESSATILLLIGAPGTGKTSFVRGLLAHRNESCMVTYSDKILSNDEFFASWMGNGTDNILVVEDADHMLWPRENGNDLMHRLLNIGDGLVKIPKKKMIFTTNISDVGKIDSAMTRPGRCFDIAKFERLTQEQANRVATKCDIELPACNSSNGTFSLAEVFTDSNVRKSAPKRTFGFV